MFTFFLYETFPIFFVRCFRVFFERRKRKSAKINVVTRDASIVMQNLASQSQEILDIGSQTGHYTGFKAYIRKGHRLNRIFRNYCNSTDC